MDSNEQSKAFSAGVLHSGQEINQRAYQRRNEAGASDCLPMVDSRHDGNYTNGHDRYEDQGQFKVLLWIGMKTPSEGNEKRE